MSYIKNIKCAAAFALAGLVTCGQAFADDKKSDFDFKNNIHTRAYFNGTLLAFQALINVHEETQGELQRLGYVNPDGSYTEKGFFVRTQILMHDEFQKERNDYEKSQATSMTQSLQPKNDPSSSDVTRSQIGGAALAMKSMLMAQEMETRKSQGMGLVDEKGALTEYGISLEKLYTKRNEAMPLCKLSVFDSQPK